MSEYSISKDLAAGYAEAVQEHLSPLLDGRGFRCVRADEFRVRYESSDVSVDIYRTGDGGIGATFELLPGAAPEIVGKAPRSFDIYDILRAAGIAKEQMTPRRSRTPEQMHTALDVLVNELREYAGPALSGDAAEYRRLDDERRERSLVYVRELQAGRTGWLWQDSGEHSIDSDAAKQR